MVNGAAISPMSVTVTASTPSTVTVDQSQATGGSQYIAVTTVAGLQPGQIISGTSIPALDTLAATIGGIQQSQAANGSFVQGTTTIPLASTSYAYYNGMQCTDTTKPSAIAAGTFIVSSVGNTSITLSNPTSAASAGANDTIVCDPVINLTTASNAAISSGATLSIYDISVQSPGYVNTTKGYFIGGQPIVTAPFPGIQGGSDLVIGENAGAGLSPSSINTTIIGTTAGSGGMTGVENTCVGINCELHMTSGAYDTGVGVFALQAETTGQSDTAIGEDSMRNTIGLSNSVAVGSNALRNANSAGPEIAIGSSAIFGNPSESNTGINNIGIGEEALYYTGATTAHDNTAIGNLAMDSASLTTANNDIAIGSGAGANITTASYGVHIGTQAGYYQSTNDQSVDIGYYAGRGTNAGAPGLDDVMIGYEAGTFDTDTVGLNTIVGALAGGKTANPNFSYDTFYGYEAGYEMYTGSYNLYLGYMVGSAGASVTGSSNILIGTSSSVDVASSSQSNEINIGNVITGLQQGATNPNVCIIGEPCILGVLRGANLNATTDQTITIQPLTSGNAGYLPTATKYIVTGVWVDNCSEGTSEAVGGLYTAASKGGNALVANTQTYANCASSTTMQTATLASAAANNTLTGGTLYFSLTTAQGSADTGDVYVEGIPFN
jgi:hypothetical protein